MGISVIDRWRGSSLRTRVLLLTLAAMIAVAVPAGFAFVWIVNGAVVKLGTLFAEKQILFDRYRGLEPLMREVSLAETVARAPVILEWAEDESDPEKARRGLAELEHYRLSFNDRSYFVVLDKSGNYYFNDRENHYEHARLRYTVSEENPQDAWYFKTRELGKGCHLNVNRDEVLDVTKVWINCIIQRDGKVLGLIGTGVDLTHFIREVVEFPQVGVQSMFVDLQGAVQAHRDSRLVELRSLTKDINAKQTVFRLLDREGDRQALAGMMQEVARGDMLVQSRFVRMDGRKVLIGVGFLDRLGWFNVTVMDVDVIIDRRLFTPVAALLAAILLAAAGLLTFLFQRKVLGRLERVERAVSRVQAGEFGGIETDPGQDEIGRLSRGLKAMAGTVADNTHRLEEMVRERTATLEALAHCDPLTGLLNRRGFENAFEARQRASGPPAGLAIIDLDEFKPVNDRHGHAAGDHVLAEIARRIGPLLGEGDVGGRWGGDEFIVLVERASTGSLALLGAQLAAAVRDRPVRLPDGSAILLRASVGVTPVEAGEDLAAAAARADGALYTIKRGGRDGYALATGADRREASGAC